MIDGMANPIYARRIADVMEADALGWEKATMLFDQYSVHNSPMERDAFVAALISRALIENSRRTVKGP